MLMNFVMSGPIGFLTVGTVAGIIAIGAMHCFYLAFEKICGFFMD